MKKYKVFVDSNGKDSLWFHQGEKVENPLVPEKSEVPAHQPSVEELNGAVLMKMFNLTGLLEHISFEAQHGWDTQVVFKEHFVDKCQYKTYVINIRTEDVKTVNYSKQVKPELQPDGSYWK